MSPRKVRIVADLIRGQGVEKALTILHFNPKVASKPLEKALRSAVANLLNDEKASKIDSDDLYVKEIKVDSGYTLRRYRAGSMGRASRIRKRTSHISIVVAELEE
jgi:large subunit ribosomal protein L22